MAQTITPEAVQQLNTVITPDKARAMLSTEITKLRDKGLPEKCIERLREILMRRTNYGTLTKEDAEFLSAMNDTQGQSDALVALCKESGNSITAMIFSIAVIGGSIAAVVAYNLFPPKRRAA